MRFRAAGLETPELDARRLVMAATRRTAEDLVLAANAQLGEVETRSIAAFEHRRLAHEPVSRIIGVREFYGREFQITRDTLDPRPDSETLIDVALGLIAEGGIRERPLRILDICTGTGCLLLTLLAELPNATGVGTDISAAAIDVARRNADQLGMAGRAGWRRTDLATDVDGAFDLIVANPPYIPSGDIGDLEREVRDYDPRLALDGGADGLEPIRRIARDVERLGTGAWVVLEMGAGQAEAVCAVVSSAAGIAKGEIRRFADLGGNIRCVAWKTQLVVSDKTLLADASLSATVSKAI